MHTLHSDIHTYLQIYIHTHIHTMVRTHMFHSNIHTYLQRHIHTHIHTMVRSYLMWRWSPNTHSGVQIYTAYTCSPNIHSVYVVCIQVHTPHTHPRENGVQIYTEYAWSPNIHSGYLDSKYTQWIFGLHLHIQQERTVYIWTPCVIFKNLKIDIQGGADPQDALSCRLFFAKESLLIGLFCGK